MRDLRRDETWLADYAARKAAQREPRNEFSEGGSHAHGVPGCQGGGQTQVDQRDLRRMESNPARSESGSTERRAERSQGIGSKETNGGVHAARILSSARRISDDESAGEMARSTVDTNNGATNHQAAVARGPLTQSTSGGIDAAHPASPVSDTKSGPLTPITRSPDLMHGISCIAGTRIPASAIKSFAAAGHSVEQIIGEYPGLTEQEIQAALDYTPSRNPMVAPQGTNKYHNKKTDGYDSKREAKRAAELRLLLAAGEITDLREQVPFVLIPRQLDADGSVAERAVKFIADFVYRDGIFDVCEDCKGLRTPDYIIKRKLMRFMHGITILET